MSAGQHRSRQGVPRSCVRTRRRPATGSQRGGLDETCAVAAFEDEDAVRTAPLVAPHASSRPKTLGHGARSSPTRSSLPPALQRDEPGAGRGTGNEIAPRSPGACPGSSSAAASPMTGRSQEDPRHGRIWRAGAGAQRGKARRRKHQGLLNGANPQSVPARLSGWSGARARQRGCDQTCWCRPGFRPCGVNRRPVG